MFEVITEKKQMLLALLLLACLASPLAAQTDCRNLGNGVPGCDAIWASPHIFDNLTPYVQDQWADEAKPPRRVLGIPDPLTPPDEPWGMHLLIWGLGAAQVADLMTTEHCITLRLCRETNPMLSWASENPLTLGAVAGALYGVEHFLILKTHNKPGGKLTAYLIAGSFLGVETWMVVRNIQHGGLR